jgi:hypothetical protein
LSNHDERMTKAERTELMQVIRKHERVLKTAANERAAKMLEEFEAQIAAIHRFDDDAVWKQAANEVDKIVATAKKQIKQRCKELGIPAEFAPNLNWGWYGRGENAVAARRAELRRVAKTQIDALTAQTRTKIERLSLEWQTKIVSNGIESAAARAFLERLPSIESLMPLLEIEEVKKLLEE